MTASVFSILHVGFSSPRFFPPSHGERAARQASIFFSIPSSRFLLDFSFSFRWVLFFFLGKPESLPTRRRRLFCFFFPVEKPLPCPTCRIPAYPWSMVRRTGCAYPPCPAVSHVPCPAAPDTPILHLTAAPKYRSWPNYVIFSSYVNKWITIATPFQGAPGCINDSLLTGLQFVDGFESFFFVSRWSFHQLLVESPSIYEMLPNPDFNWKKQPEIHVWRKHTSDGETSVGMETYGRNECITLFEEALKNNELKYSGKQWLSLSNSAILKWAVGTREVLDKTQIPHGVYFYNIYGTSFDMPFDVRFWTSDTAPICIYIISPFCSYGSESSPIDELSEICHTLPEYTPM